MRDAPVLATACVVDRPGYNARYAKMYDRSERWLLCKSAFSICVERAAKHASKHDRKLRVYVEKSDKRTDATIAGYYGAMREEGMPFSKVTSDKYMPFGKGELSKCLYEFRTKAKSSPLMQLADLFLWPVCMGGYKEDCRPFVRLKDDNKLIDSVLEKECIPTEGIKYYCFDNKKPG